MAENNNRNMGNFEMLEIKQIVTSDGAMSKNNKDEKLKTLMVLSFVSTDHREHYGDVAARPQREAVAAGARHQSRYFDEFRYKRFL